VSSRCLRQLWFVFIAALVLVPGALAESSSFEEIKARYLKLRNTDVTVAREAEWRRVGADFERFAENSAGDRQAPLALIDAAIVYVEVYKRSRDERMLERGLVNLERVAKRYPSDPLADDALLKRGEILLDERKDRSAAEEAFRDLIARYPDADMTGVARERLRRMEDSAEEKVPVAPQHGVRQGTLIVIDPGHGAEDFGAEGPGGILEKDVTLAVAREVAALLKKEAGFAVKMTRTDDSFLPLLERTAFANNVEADLFVSIHVNASPAGKLHGVETYYLDTTDGESSRTLAERENASVRFEGPAGDLAYMLSDLVQSAKTTESIRLAKLIQSGLVGQLRARWPEVKDLGVKKALFYVLVGAHMPCALVELGFLDHSVEGKRLSTEEYRREVARGIADAVRRYFAGGAPQ